jgi:hypothetical protein
MKANYISFGRPEISDFSELFEAPVTITVYKQYKRSENMHVP